MQMLKTFMGSILELNILLSFHKLSLNINDE